MNSVASLRCWTNWQRPESVAAVILPFSSLIFHFFQFGQEDFEELILGDFSEDLSFFENNPHAVSSGDADIGLTGLPRAVDYASHHCNFERCMHRLDNLLDLFSQTEEIDTRPAASRTGNKLRATLANL